MPEHALIGQAKHLPIDPPTPVLSVSPIVLSVPGRIVELEVRVSAPTTGKDLPIILLSHGGGPSNYIPSIYGYGPLANFWAAHGFVVIQPTHLSSNVLKLDPSTPGWPAFWQSRVEDMKHILDQLDHIESVVPAIKGRLDRSRVAVAGHSLGGHTACVLLGERFTDEDGTIVNMIEPRIKAGVLLATVGNGADIKPAVTKRFPFFEHSSFAEMTTPALVVYGDADVAPYFTDRGADWHADSYSLSTGPKSLLTLFGAKHGLGGIAGYDAAETDDESPERLAAVQRLTWAYLRTALYPDDPAWSTACTALAELNAIGKIESK